MCLLKRVFSRSAKGGGYNSIPAVIIVEVGARSVQCAGRGKPFRKLFCETAGMYKTKIPGVAVERPYFTYYVRFQSYEHWLLLCSQAVG